MSLLASLWLAPVQADGTLGHEQAAYPLTGTGTAPSPVPLLTRRSTAAAVEQVDPLMATVSIEFGPEIATIGEAARIVVESIGYELLTQGDNTSRLLPGLLGSPLPSTQRSMDHLRVNEILRALAGVGHVAVVDQVHRRVTFDPRPRYLPIGQASLPGASVVTLVPVQQSGTGAGGHGGNAQVGSFSRQVAAVVGEVAPGSSVLRELRADSENAGWSAVQGDEDDAEADVSARPVSSDISNRASAQGSGSESAGWSLIETMADQQRLNTDAERVLRGIAGEHETGATVVLVSDCSTGADAASVVRARWLIGSALNRLGVPRQSQGEEPCTLTARESGAGTLHALRLRAMPGDTR